MPFNTIDRQAQVFLERHDSNIKEISYRSRIALGTMMRARTHTHILTYRIRPMRKGIKED